MWSHSQALSNLIANVIPSWKVTAHVLKDHLGGAGKGDDNLVRLFLLMVVETMELYYMRHYYMVIRLF